MLDEQYCESAGRGTSSHTARWVTGVAPPAHDVSDHWPEPKLIRVQLPVPSLPGVQLL
jgi:hypothetical protein